MAGELVPDVLEKIMIGLDVNDLIRFKSVCKSWYSFICSTRFVKAHLDYSYNNDRSNNDIEHRRIIRDWSPLPHMRNFLYEYGSYLVGSSNGLVCISPSHAQVFVANPLTREVNMLPNPQVPDFSDSCSLCWGFGYDSCADDYKVIVGFNRGGDRTCFQVLTLKSNIWKLIGEVKYSINISSIGILCNEALHWFMNDQNNAKVILSFHLSKQEFKEIPHPDDDYTVESINRSHLGIIKECLCIFDGDTVSIMKEYNVKESWDFLHSDLEAYVKDEVIHCLNELTHDNIPYERSLCHDIFYCSETWEFISAPIFVQSLVSPHAHRGLKRKQQVENNDTGLKLQD